MTVVVLALLGLSACQPSDDTAAAECVDDGDCEGLAVCDPGNTCRPVECIDSSQCSLGNHCNPDANACFTGCREDSDCLAGEDCDTGTTDCVPAACTDTEVDCYVGQQCFPEQGECLMPPGMCLDCYDYANRQECANTWGGSCHSTPGGGWWCLLECNPSDDDDGPRQFTCRELTTDNWRWYGNCSEALQAPQD